MERTSRIDLIIIGASAAGVTSAIYAARRELNFRVLTGDIGGEVSTSGEIDNYTGIPHTDGFELTERFKEQLQRYQAKITESVTIERIERRGADFVVHGKTLQGAETWTARSVILATGAHPKKLGVPGESELRGKGVTYCTTCDGPLFKGKTVATIGGGNSALESALMLAEIAQHVTLINKNPQFKGDAILVDKVHAHPNITVIPEAKTSAFLGDKILAGLRYANTQTGAEQKIDIQGAFIHIGLQPNSSMVDFVTKTRTGEIIVDLGSATDVPGFFAAGDVTNAPFKQIAVAVGQGAAAALSVVRYLNSLK